MPTRVIRLRSVDTNPVVDPSRLLPAHRRKPAVLFAKCATVVTKVYSRHLDSGEPVVAENSRVRLVPTDMTGPVVLPLGQSDMGVVLDVPYDSAVLNLPDRERRLAMLDWLQQHMMELAGALGWQTGPLVAAYEACVRDECRFTERGVAKTSPDRQHKAYVEFEIDGDGDGWSWVVATDPRGVITAVSERRDSPASITLGARVLKSLKWDGDVVTWKPWTEEIAPRGHEFWMTHIERFPVLAK